MQYKAIITDLDRTLLRTDKTLSAYTVSVLRKVKEKGIMLIAATARPIRSVAQYDELIGFDGLITLNGAYIKWDGGSVCNSIPYEKASLFTEKVLEKHQCIISAEVDGVLYANTVFPEWESVYYTDFPAFPAGNLHKIIFTYSEELLNTVNAAMPAGMYCTVANQQLIQVMSKKATKWNGIVALLEKSGFSPYETIYFGDDNDDILPLRECGMGVAVANGIQEAKDAADLITASNDEDGVARFIEQTFTIGNIQL